MISVGGVVERSGTMVTASAPTTLTVGNNSGLIITGPGTGSLAPGCHLPFRCRALVVASDDDPWPLVLDQRADPAGHLGRRDVACTSCAAWSYGTSACRSPGQHGTPDRLPDVIRTASNLVAFDQGCPDRRHRRVRPEGRRRARVASTRQVGRIRVVEVENKDEGFRRLRIRAAD